MKRLLSIFIITVSLAYLHISVALAQEDSYGLNDLNNSNIALGSAGSVQDIVISIINIVLGFLGILAVLLILYGGYLWMTSRGNSEKVQRAKLLIVSALIGLVIILSAYAISRFVLGRLYDVIGPINTSEEEEGPPGDLIPCPNDGVIRICYIHPTIGTVGSYVTIVGHNFGADVGTVDFVNLASGVSTSAEMVTCGDQVMWNNTRVKVQVPEVDAATDYRIELHTADGSSSLEDFPPEFRVTGGAPGPNIACVVPASSPVGGLPLAVEVQGFGFTNTTSELYMTGWDSATATEIDPLNLPVSNWTDTLIQAQIPDNALASYITVATAFGEADEYFAITCDDATAEECASGCCNHNQCRPLDICNGSSGLTGGPYIEAIYPPDGNAGDLITIYGGNFGDDPGRVVFNYNEAATIDGDPLPNPPCSGDNWHDNYIITRVPAGAITDDLVVIQGGLGGQESNGMLFTRTTNSPRPGVCGLVPDSGVYQDDISVSGINFVDGDDAYFGEVVSYNTNIDSVDQITAEVPNIVGSVGVSIRRDAIASNSYPFSALAVGNGDPIIYSIDPIPPDAARVGQAITVMGANFGQLGPDSDVRFDGLSGNFDFSPMCGSGFWDTDRIIVKVPDGLGFGTHPVQVVRDNGVDVSFSNLENMVLEAGLPGPNLCYLQPDNGPAGTSVNLAGENFGSADGNILFQDGLLGVHGTSYSWNDGAVSDVLVPGGAVTGLVHLVDNEGTASNGMPFNVGSCPSVDEAGNTYCDNFGLGDICCPGVAGNICVAGASCDSINSCSYTWNVETERDPFGLLFNYNCDNDLQSPSPWPDEWEGHESRDAYPNINLRALFNRNVDDADFNPANISVWRCGEGGLYDITDCAPTAGGVEIAGILEIINHDSSREGVVFIPDNPLDENYWYHINLGIFNSEVGNDIWMPSYEDVGFDWHFRTRDSSNLCPIDSVAVSPQSPAADFYLGHYRDFYASPSADNCNMCNGDYSWTWDITDDPDGGDLYSHATLLTGLSPAPIGTARLTGIQVTEPQHVTLQSTNNDFSISGDTSPQILSPRLLVEDYEPNCGNDSCSNGAVYVEFNTELSAASLDIGNFGIYSYQNGLIVGISLTESLDSGWVGDNFRVTLNHPDLTLDGQYIVIIDSAISNVYGYLLDEDGDDFTYIFGVGHQNCEFASARVKPTYRLARNVDPIGYLADPRSDSGICGGAPLQCLTCNYTWEVVDTGVAALTGLPSRLAYITPVADGSTEINVEIEQAGHTVSTPPGQGLLDVLFSVPSVTGLAVTGHWPDCNNACTNSLVTINFNSNLNPTTADHNGANFYILDASGTRLTGDDDVELVNNRRVTINNPGFALGETYTVEITTGVLNTDGQSLTELSGPPTGIGYRWDFIVGLANCEVNDLEVVPASLSAGSNETLSGSRSFTAVPQHFDIDCGEAPVWCENCEYNWELSPSGVATIADPSAQNPTITTEPDVSIGDFTNATASLLTTPYTASGLLTIDQSGESVDPPFIHTIEPVDGEENVCLNAAVVIQFSELMDTDSIDTNIALYSGDDVSDIVPGAWHFRSLDFDGDGDRETEAVFFPDVLLAVDTEHWVALAPSVISSVAGLNLITNWPSPIILGATPFAGTVGWHFTTSDETCTIHSALIDPGPDAFTCAQRDDCADDDDPFTDNNQHQYNAYAYDIEGNTLSGTFLSYDWSTREEGLLGLAEGDAESYATPLVNYGTDTLSVRINSLADDSSAGDSARIDIFICQSPWPSPIAYPWTENIYHFSTFYCQYSGWPGDEVSLPSLEYPPTPNPLYPNPEDPDILREYIFAINNAVAAVPGAFGSLAFDNQNQFNNQVKANEPWWKKIAGLFFTKAVKGQIDGGGDDDGGMIFDPSTLPPALVNFVYTEADENHVVMTWSTYGGNHNLDHFNLYRSVGGSPFQLLTTLEASVRTFTDEDPVPYITNTYRLVAVSDSGVVSPSPAMLYVFVSSHSAMDYIAIRMMRNNDHLSVRDWYNERFSETAGEGQIFEVDGYEALRVGNTVYIAATNIAADNHLYTNIYIISYNIGASANTINVYNQLVQNFKLSINVWLETDNVCSGTESDVSCTTDFDCSGYCRAQGLKLRRDTKRLGELVGIGRRLDNYSISHRACSNNVNISCTEDSQCPGFAPCVPYYPGLEAGSYLQGFSTSRWPVSWTNTLSSNLGATLPVDPVNLFNGCPDANADPETCWNEEAVPPEPRFSCAENSLIYIYKIENNAQDYYLGANFEYDMQNPSSIGWNSLLPNWAQPATANINHTLTDCNGEVINAPGFSTNPYCGNGRIDSGYCTISDYTDIGPCIIGGGTWVSQEECDLFDWPYGCSEDPPRQNGAFPHISAVPPAGANWWHDRPIGCNPPGTLNEAGQLIECTWHRPTPAYTPAQCGGRCGDGTIQPAFEGCEGSNFYGTYTCAEGDGNPYCGTGCQPLCSGSGGTYPAASCGDSVWDQDIEQCDSSATPNGTGTWDCSGGGIARCNNSCEIYCSDASDPYVGLCGDGEVTAPEQCDYADFVSPLPDQSGPDNTYGCNTLCQFTDAYCGDGDVQEEYQELCDPAATYIIPATIESAQFRQYACRASGYYPSATANPHYGACTATAGGWCGDGILQSSIEYCDPGNPWTTPATLPDYPDGPATPAQSSEDRQYACNYDCLSDTGGWCGDNDAQTNYGELCDGVDYPGRPTPEETIGGALRYTCDMDDPVMKCRQFDPNGSYCGDGVPDYQFLEGCDWDNNDPAFWPAPRGDSGPLATAITQYQCINCENNGGWCGDGNVNGGCSVPDCVGCTESECSDLGGTFTPYEDCDSGFDPARIIDKDVDLVYVFDMSGSLLEEAVDLCNATQELVTTLNTEHPEINYRISIMVLGDNDDGFTEVVDSDANGYPESVTIGATPVALTPSNHADDINYYYGATTWPTTTDNQPDTSLVPYNHYTLVSQQAWVYKSKLVFRALVSDCPLFINNHDSNPANDFPNVRYLSFYDNATNDIYQTVYRDSGGWEDWEYIPYPVCDENNDFGGRIENWGYAINKVIDGYSWLPGHEKIVVPISDEGAWCGGNGGTVDTRIDDYEDYDQIGSFWHLVPDILVRARVHALAQDPIVHISPVLFTYNLLVDPIGPALAADTMGTFTNLTSDWAIHTVQTINSTFCDGDGDGHMDCSLPE